MSRRRNFGAAAVVVMRKELRDAVRDRRFLFSLLSLLIGPILFPAFLTRVINKRLRRLGMPRFGCVTQSAPRSFWVSLKRTM